MNRGIVCFVSGMLLMVSSGAYASGRYLRHPVFQKLPEMKMRVESQIGYGDDGDMPVGVLGALGVAMGKSLTVGAFGQIVTSDRDLPSKTERIFGFGGFAEYAFDIGYTLAPYTGLRVGILDFTGPVAPTLPYVGGYLGLKYPLTPSWTITVAATLHWAGEKDDYKAYNYRKTGPYTYKADATDLTFDAGLRYTF